MNGLPSPHVVVALVRQLITVAGVPGEDITIYEVANGRNVGQPIYTRIRAESDRDFQAVRSWRDQGSCALFIKQVEPLVRIQGRASGEAFEFMLGLACAPVNGHPPLGLLVPARVEGVVDEQGSARDCIHGAGPEVFCRDRIVRGFETVAPSVFCIGCAVEDASAAIHG